MSHAAEVPLRVIGVGSPFGADAVGFQAIERLRKENDLFPTGTELLALDRPGSTLIPLLEKSTAVVLIDAMQSGQPPGTVQRLLPEELLVQGGQPSSHTLGVAETLALAEALKMLPDNLFVYGIEADEGVLTASWYDRLRQLLIEDMPQ